MAGLAIGFVMLLFCTASAAAPESSFDCGKAQGVDERVICSDPLLRGADQTLHTAYVAARAASRDPVHRASLKSDEHEWILRRNNECGITKFTIVTSSNRPAYVDCMLDEYDERIADMRQMRLHPGVDPAAISLPIRRSFLAAAAPPVSAGIATKTFQIPAGQIAALAWRQDGVLLILGVNATGSSTIYAWQQDDVQIVSAHPKATELAGFCEDVSGTALTGAVDLPCPKGGSLRTAAGAGNTMLYLGPAEIGQTPAPRFVTLTGAAGARTVEPEIRIDSRYHLQARFSDFADVFVVSPTDDPAILNYQAVRRWSKTNCLSYWLVSPQTAGAAAGCIPFGVYVTAMPVPLLARTAVYIWAAGFGLYRIDHASAQQVIAGNFIQPAVSPDGCTIALAPMAVSPIVQMQDSRTVSVLTLCINGS